MPLKLKSGLGKKKLSSKEPEITPTPVEELADRTIGELINEWCESLHGQSIAFQKEAQRVVHWESEIRSNQKRIDSLKDTWERLSTTQNEVSNQLSLLEKRQTELDTILNDVEASLEKKEAENTSKPSGNVVRDRQEMLRRVQELDVFTENLEDKYRRLADKVAETNSTSNNNLSSDLVHIQSIINHQVQSIQWLDSQTRTLTSQLDRIKSHK
ncbi:hypothetical protein PCE1_003069 [Barthelona sp. PCE]